MANRGRRQTIRDVFEALGTPSIDRLVGHLVDAGVYSEDEYHGLALRAIKGDCRSALKEEAVPGSIPGLSYAYAVRVDSEDEDEDGDHDNGYYWKAATLMGLEDFMLVIDERSKDLDNDHLKMRAIRDHCLKRFGVSIEIPEISLPTTA